MSHVMTATATVPAIAPVDILGIQDPLPCNSEVWNDAGTIGSGPARGHAGSGASIDSPCAEAGGKDSRPASERMEGRSGQTQSSRDLPETRATGEDEQRLLKLIASGDKDAFWQLWQNYRSYLFGICAKHCGGINEDVEDVLSRAMIRA